MIPKFQYAPLLNRLFAYIIDVIFSTILLTFFTIPTLFFVGRNFFTEDKSNFIFALFFLPIFIWSYYIFTEYKWGFTLGKKITGLRVINSSGGKPKLKSIILRTIFKVIPFNSLALFFNEYRGWHDRIAETYVIRDYSLD